MNRKYLSIFLLIIAGVLATSAVFIIFSKNNKNTSNLNIKSIEQIQDQKINTLEAIPNIDRDISSSENIILKESYFDPESLLKDINLALINKNPKILDKFIINNKDETIKLLENLINQDGFKILELIKPKEIGEVDKNNVTRWSIVYSTNDSQHQELHLDLRKENKNWMIDQIFLKDSPIFNTSAADPLYITDEFVSSIIRQDFIKARTYLEPNSISDAKLAAMCILFEEGKFQMRSKKPIRILIQNETTLSYLVNVINTDEQESAEFGLNLRKTNSDEKWSIFELNLDHLLTEYSKRVAEGDVYYSPIVKSPSGGDTLALYFGFDEKSMCDRTIRQLNVIVSLLKNDRAKKITLTGHTDVRGTNKYNQGLSKDRAKSVADYLISNGVPNDQINLTAVGSSQPRRPNFTESGEDDPLGRRANRRTEIYLDF